MENKVKAMAMASLIADSLALGVHWIYDVDLIANEFGRVEELLKPTSDSYHPSKDKGEFTHYGDQAFVLLESLAAKRGFDGADFSNRWRTLFQDYAGYYDHATKDTLENLSRGLNFEEAGSSSGDLAGATRIAPLVYYYRSDLDKLLEAVELQTKMTHNNPGVLQCADFLSRVSWMVLEGQPPAFAIEKVADRLSNESPLSDWVSKGLESKDNDSVETIAGFGQTCNHADAFSGVIHLIVKYESDLKEALIQSVMAGGDSAARGMAVGLVLGAHLGMENIPAHWVSGLKKFSQIQGLLDCLS